MYRLQVTLVIILTSICWCAGNRFVRGTPTKRNSDSVCFQNFGCFHTHGSTPVPQTPEEVNTHLHLFHRIGHSQSDVIFDVDKYQSRVAHFASNIDASKQTKIIIHGYVSSINSSWMLETKDALMAKGDFNVIVVDWGSGSNVLYHQAVGNTFLVGAEIAQVLKYLHNHRHLRYQDVHIIGHSLGAQIAGHIGHSLPGIGRISGLDPADPGFHGQPADRRLDKSDAQFVDVIHTDASGFIGVSGYGMRQPIGHVDFYPNGGQHQPGCEERPLSGVIQSLITGSLAGAKGAITCSHSRAIKYFMESITSACKFRAHSCSSFSTFENGQCLSCPAGQCTIMGYDADQLNARGSFYLSTSNDAPFCAAEGFSTDSVHRHVIATHTDIGTVTGIQAKFEMSLHASPAVRIDRVVVKEAQTDASTLLCGHDAQVSDGNTLTLTSSAGC